MSNCYCNNECERELYKTLTIGGISVPVYFDDELLEEGCLGFSDFSSFGAEICLSPALKDNQELFQTTLYHELYHMVSSIYSLGFEECDVSVLAIATLDLQSQLGDITITDGPPPPPATTTAKKSKPKKG